MKSIDKELISSCAKLAANSELLKNAQMEVDSRAFSKTNSNKKKAKLEVDGDELNKVIHKGKPAPLSYSNEHMAVKKKKQKEVASLEHIYAEWWLPKPDTKYVIHVGKTGSGKTYNALQALKTARLGAYLSPLRLLAWEVHEKLNNEGVQCNLVTGEETVVTSRNAKIVSCTIEMLDYSKEYDVVIVDESFLIGDEDRGKSWLKAILKTNSKEIHIITNDEAIDLIKNILDVAQREYTEKRYEMLQQFKFSESHFIISKNMPNKGVFVTFSRIDVLVNKFKFESLGKKVSVLYGNLPPEVKKKQIEDFISGNTDILVTTDVIGMGINVPCDYLVFLEITKYDGKQSRALNPIEVRQISGRTGRYGMSSQDAFVSCTKQKGLSLIKSQYTVDKKITKAYFGMDYEVFSLAADKKLYDRIEYFSNAKLIPEHLKSIISKESVVKYKDLAFAISNAKLQLKDEWAFLTAPVKNNNRDYFNHIVYKYGKESILLPPTNTEIQLNDSILIESKISEIELYINLTRNLQFKTDDFNYMVEAKKYLVQKLESILLDKKLSSKKKCKTCTHMLDITYPYPYCNDCYTSRYRNDDWY